MNDERRNESETVSFKKPRLQRKKNRGKKKNRNLLNQQQDDLFSKGGNRDMRTEGAKMWEPRKNNRNLLFAEQHYVMDRSTNRGQR